ncbi:MAG: type IV pilus assembly protein PilM [Firmicutes bacterium]|jgi:type IV pilus assembly protein PilM|nr:type IV pilus assembly protein PilM [Bacillota bacterium]MDH7495056.1 type IV pilus assembly protein PilM [Bacillota bacterium]
MLRFCGAKRAVGLDIGTTLIKVVEISKTKRATEIVRAGIHPTPEGAVADGSVLDPPNVAFAVKEAMRAAGIRATEVYAAIAGDDVVVRHVTFPRMPKEELAQAVKWEAGAYIPYAAKDASIDYQVVGPVPHFPDKLEVMIVAAPKKLVESHVRTLQLAGLYPLALDIQPVTLDRIFRGASSGGSGFYADIGGGTTDLAYTEHGVLRFTRIVGIGGNDFTAAVAEATGRSSSWAESAKREHRVSKSPGPPGVGVSPAPGDGVQGDAESDVVGRALARVAARLALEIRRSIDYCEAQARTRLGEDARITSVILTGGGSKLAGLGEFLEKSVSVRIISGDPLRNPSPARAPRLSDVLAEHGPSLSVAIGLALRGVEES